MKKKKRNQKLSQNGLKTCSVVMHFKLKKINVSSHERKKIIEKKKNKKKKTKLKSVLTRNLGVVKAPS